MQTIESVGVNPSSLSTTYCTPLYGPFTTTLSNNTYIVCYATQEECYYKKWTSQSGGKELLSGIQCRADNANSVSYGAANRWRCAKNYYEANGKSIVTGSVASVITCTACPNNGSTSGLTDGPGKSSITSCYIPSGTYSETTGTYTTPDCYYQN